MEEIVKMTDLEAVKVLLPLVFISLSTVFMITAIIIYKIKNPIYKNFAALSGFASALAGIGALASIDAPITAIIAVMIFMISFLAANLNKKYFLTLAIIGLMLMILYVFFIYYIHKGL